MARETERKGTGVGGQRGGEEDEEEAWNVDGPPTVRAEEREQRDPTHPVRKKREEDARPRRRRTEAQQQPDEEFPPRAPPGGELGELGECCGPSLIPLASLLMSKTPSWIFR